MRDDMTPDEIMDRAADLLDYYGWCKRAFRNDKNEMCVFGAIQTAAGSENFSFCGVSTAQRNVTAFIEAALAMGITRWNDTYCVSGDEAAQMLRMKAKHWREDPVAAEYACARNQEAAANVRMRKLMV